MSHTEVPLKVYFQARDLCTNREDIQELAISVQPSNEEGYVKILTKFVPASFFETEFQHIANATQALEAIQQHWEARNDPKVSAQIGRMIRRILK